MLRDDQAPLTPFSCTAGQTVWRRRGDRYADNCVVENNAWGGPSLMLWGAIGHNQVLGPVISQGLGPGRGNGITAQRYMYQVLHPHVLPFFQAHGNWHDRYGGGSLMVWGAISVQGKTDLHVFWNGTLTAIRYRDEILDPVVRPYTGAIGPEFILMDDNARPHTARIVDQYLEEESMEWPARSPDLNPVEHVWDMIGRAVHARVNPTRTLVQLGQALQQEWDQIPQQTIRNLICSMRRRCQAVIPARGGHTRY
nr:hypothetical protein BaRGS_031675 [Batillaria attramentaria]